MEYFFPEYRQQYEQIAMSQIRKKIADQAQAIDFDIQYKFRLVKKHYYYVNCKLCKAIMKFKLNTQNQMLKLVYFNNKHIHLPKRKRLFQNDQLNSFIEDLPNKLDLKKAKAITLNQFPAIKEHQFYYRYNKYKNFEYSFQQLINHLEEGYQCEIYSQPFVDMHKVNSFHEKNNKIGSIQGRMNGQNQKIDERKVISSRNFCPEILLVVTKSMRENYELFKDFIGFDCTYNLIKQPGSSSNKKIKVGFFAGLSSSRHITPFGVAFMAEQSKLQYLNVFTSFFKIMKSQLPNCLITDDAPVLKAVIKQINQNEQENKVNHLLDAFHVLKTTRKKLERKQSIIYFSKLITAKNQQQFQKALAQAYEFLIDEDISILNIFLQNKHMYCFSQTKKIMMGTNSSSSFNQKLNDLIKNIIPIELGFSKAVVKIVQKLQQLSNSCRRYNIQKIKFENYFHIIQIKQIRCLLDAKVFAIFLRQISQIYLLKCNQIDDYTHEVEKQNFNFVVRKTGVNYLRCSCQYFQRSGLICQHMAIVCLRLKIRMIQFIDKRWIAAQNIQYKKRQPRGRYSRRNKLK